MIIMGGSRGGGAALGNYLQSVGKNERIALVEIRGTVAQDVLGAVKEMEAYGDATRCEKPLYHAMICPQPGYKMTPEQFLEAVNLLEKELGLEGQPRVVVAHEKNGEEHRHVAWSRIDLEHLKAIPDSHNFAKHEKVARELERRFGHPHTQGAHADRDNVDRPDRSPSRPELRQEEITGVKSKDVRQEVTTLFRASENADVFKTKLEGNGYILAQGDRRDFVIVDRAGGEHSLARRISGMKAGDLREFMAPIDKATLPTVAEAMQIAQDRLSGMSDFDQQCWDDALAASAIDKEKAADQARERNTAAAKAADRAHEQSDRDALQWEDRLARSAIDKAETDDAENQRRREQAKEARTEANLQAHYSRGQDYVTQSSAALEDHERRRKLLDDDAPRPAKPEERSETDERLSQILADHDTNRRRRVDAAATETTGARAREAEIEARFDHVEMTEAQRARMKRQIDSGGLDEDYEPDRQREVPGGGHTRSR